MQTVEFEPVKVDLHFHTDGSPDGRNTEEDVEEFLQDGTLGIIAITDHDSIDTALRLKERHPSAIIVGIEVTTAEGELVCLGIRKRIEEGMSAVETAQACRAQGGKNMLQHPFHKNGLSEEVALQVHAAVGIDLNEVNNGRDMLKWWYNIRAKRFAQEFGIPMVSNGDCHGPPGVGRSHTKISRMPDVNDMDDVIDTLRYQQVGRATRFAGVRALRQPSLARKEKARAVA